MGNIQSWLHQTRISWQADFIGVAANRAPRNQVKEIRWIFADGNHSEAFRNIRLQVGRGVAGIIWKTGRSHTEDQILAQPEKLLEYPIARIEKLNAVLGIPLMENQEVVAILLIGYQGNHRFSADEQQKFAKKGMELSALKEFKEYV